MPRATSCETAGVIWDLGTAALRASSEAVWLSSPSMPMMARCSRVRSPVTALEVHQEELLVKDRQDKEQVLEDQVDSSVSRGELVHGVNS